MAKPSLDELWNDSASYAALEEEHGLPSGLLDAVARQESGYKDNAVSGKGAIGRFQFMPETAKELGIDPADPKQAAIGAARYLKRGLDANGGNLDLALAAYNAGQGNVDKYGDVPPFAETQNYVKSIKAMLPHQDAGGAKPSLDDLWSESTALPPNEIPQPGKQPTAYDGGGKLEAGLRGFSQGVTAGGVDELVSPAVAAIMRVLRPDLFEGQAYGQTVNEAVQATRGNNKASSEANPGSYITGDIAGAIASPVNFVVPGGGVVRTAAQGAVSGAAQGFGRSESNDVAQTLLDTGIGGAIGGAAGGALAIAGKGISAVAGKIAQAIKGGAGAVDDQTARAVQIMLDEGKTPQEILRAASQTDKARGALETTVFEQAQSPMGTAVQRAMTEQPSPAGSFMKDFNRVRETQQLPDVVEKAIYGKASTQSPVVAAQNAKLSAKEILDDTIGQRSAAVKPLYEKAAKVTVPDQVIGELISPAKNPVFSSLMKSLPKDPLFQQKTMGMQPNSAGYLNEVKKSISGMLDVAKRTGNRDEARSLGQALTSAKDQLYKVSPGLKVADEEFIQQSPTVAKVAKGLVGRIANAKNENQIPTMVFQEKPEAIAATRNYFHTSGKGQEWDDLVAAHIGNLDDKSSGSIRSILQKLDGNKQVSKQMEAAMGPRGYQGQRLLIRNLRRIQEGLPRNSETVSKLEGRALLMNDRAMDIPTDKLEAINWVKNIFRAGSKADRLAKTNANNLEFAKAITSPDLTEYAKALRGLTAKQQANQTIEYLTKFLPGTSGAAAGEASNAVRPR